MDELAGPFGLPDGSMGDLAEVLGDLVELPSKFGGIARDPSDARVRVLAGPLGSGKSFLMRRMQDIRVQDGSTYASDVQRNDDLTTHLVVELHSLMNLQSSNTEIWTLLWKRAIFRAAWSFLRNVSALNDPIHRSTISETAMAYDYLEQQEELLGRPSTPRRVSSQAARIIGQFDGRRQLEDFLHNEEWEAIDYHMRQILRYAPPMFLYVDDIDRNYGWAPSFWTQCQRGLFYAVMHLTQEDVLRTRLHVVVALRDITLSTVAAGEHGPRYLEDMHINHLRWTRESALEFLKAKVRSLPDRYFTNPGDKSVESWLGLSDLSSSRASSPTELAGGYLVRHTRLVPRDIVILGNGICTELDQHGRASLTEDRLKEIVGATSRSMIRSQLNVCAAHVLSDSITADALQHDYDHVYLSPSPDVVQDRVDGIVTLIESTKKEAFSPRILSHMDDRGEAILGESSRISNVLWQHRLLGWADESEQVHFFEPRDYFGRNLLPRSAAVKQYVWHCMVHDIASGLDVNAINPAFPV